jgi:HlyD family secretion protein
MKKFFFFLLLAALGSFLFWYYQKPKPVAVIVGTAERGNIESTVVNTRAGTLKACRRALLAPAIGGQIESMPVKKGMQVKAGDILLTLWNKDFEAEVALSRKEVKAAGMNADAACLEADIAGRQAERYRLLQKNKAVPEEETDRIISQAEVQQAQCVAARDTVEVQRARLRASEARLEKTVLVAPFDGIVADVNGEVGEYVTPSPPGIPTLPAVDLVDDSCFYVSAPIDEVDASAIRVGMESRVSMDAFSGRSFKGRVQRIADYVLDREKQARTVDIEVAFDKTEDLQGMLPGYSADAEVILRTRNDIVRVPAEAVTGDGKVFVLRKADGRLEERAVSTGIANWQYIEITKGLSSGEKVVLSTDRKGVKDGALAVEEKK